LPVQGDRESGGDAEGSSSGPVDGVHDGSGRSWSAVYMELGELLLRVRGEDFAEERDRRAQIGQLRGAGGAVAEVLLEGGEVAAERVRGPCEEHIAELLVSEMVG
jgi:hypothetical protein